MIDTKIYPSFESCPVGAWCEDPYYHAGARLIYRYGNNKYERERMVSNQACVNIREMARLAAIGQEKEEKNSYSGTIEEKASVLEQIVADLEEKNRELMEASDIAAAFDRQTRTIRDVGAGIVEAIGLHTKWVIPDKYDNDTSVRHALDEFSIIADRIREGK